MASPVLLALRMNKVDSRNKGNSSVRDSVSYLAAASLEFSIILFLWLWVSSSQLLKHYHRPRLILYVTSKMLVRVCSIILLALTSCIVLLIINIDKTILVLLVVLPVFITIIISSTCISSATTSEENDAQILHGLKSDDELEWSVDFTASMTALVFIGLGRFAFEVEDQETVHVGGDLYIPVVISFVVCILGVFFTLCGIIPLEAKTQDHVRTFLDWSNCLVAAGVFAVVTWITWVIMKPMACLLFVPPIVTLFLWLYGYLGNQLRQPPAEEDRQVVVNFLQPVGAEPWPLILLAVTQFLWLYGYRISSGTKPAPLELTKATFTAFLLVAIPSIGDSSVHSYTRAFILFTAAALVWGLLSRLLTHRTESPPSAVTATHFASFMAHSCLLAAIILFTLMARSATS